MRVVDAVWIQTPAGVLWKIGTMNLECFEARKIATQRFPWLWRERSRGEHKSDALPWNGEFYGPPFVDVAMVVDGALYLSATAEPR